MSIGAGLSRRPGHLPATEQVKMQVEDRLSRIGVAVEHRSISAGAMTVVFGDRCRASHYLSNQRVVFRREVVQARDVPSRDDEDMRRCLRRDVFERDDVVVLIHDGRGNLSGDKFAEKAVAHITSSERRHAECPGDPA